MSLTSTWEQEMSVLVAEMEQMRRHGQWQTGAKTLLGALRIHHHEVLMCRGLGWLLSPDGWHGLGTGLLERFLRLLGEPEAAAGQARVTLEEVRGESRADIVIRMPGQCVLIEAKIWAGEGIDQAILLSQRWAVELPRLVFLTREGRLARSAGDSAWEPVAWSQIAELLEEAIDASDHPSPGALEYLYTLRRYGGQAA